MDNLDPPATFLFAISKDNLLEIFDRMSTSELRKFRVNRGLKILIEDYLARYRHNSRLCALPDKILLNIAERLTLEDCWCLRATSQRFYPIVMDLIVRNDVEFNSSSLLVTASELNLVWLARKVVQRGGDVNRGSWWHADGRGKPLTLAALNRSEDMVKYLLKAGASPLIKKRRASTIRGNEFVSRIMCEHLNPYEVLPTSPPQPIFQRACARGIPEFVCYFLDTMAKCKEKDVEKWSAELNDALCLMSARSRWDSRVDEKLRIVSLLLQNGADPECLIKRKAGIEITRVRVAIENELRIMRIS